MIYRFKFEHEFGDNFCPSKGIGVYVPSLPKPYVLFRDWTSSQNPNERGHRVTCYNCEYDGIWGVTEWIDPPPPDLLKQVVGEEDEQSMTIRSTGPEERT